MYLPDKAREVRMLEIYGKNLFLKFFYILNDKRGPSLSPSHNMRILLIFQYVITLFNKVADGLLCFFC